MGDDLKILHKFLMSSILSMEFNNSNLFDKSLFFVSKKYEIKTKKSLFLPI